MELGSNIEWKKWGKEDPFCSVASWAGHGAAAQRPGLRKNFMPGGVRLEGFWALLGTIWSRSQKLL
jgi:hypothetical protein